ncbi:alkaline phosphatase D family protein [Vibrio navarrensis]|uniref:alkaline phosphatase D family protein n=1 Tax=Vibrio navarrensis TaxID=29495 RepID=UPI001869B9A6|nr:alkaline phosphatase D family protein [Vibrio navarrensis]MBE4617976.1 alkaline phosphatase [Vibrio navarrensis]
MSLSRRGFIKVMSSGVVATSLMACHSKSENSASSVSFEHGVASGDPLQTAVIIWTRVTTQSSQARVTWQVASKADFSDIVAFGEITTDSEKDFTVKADAKGLSAGQHYFYRFLCEGAISPTGQTKTLAQGELSAASLAVVSCSNYPAGYFNVYREIVNQHAQKPFDAILHLGDYIYEYGKDGYATSHAQELGRVPSRETECLSLEDYRARYAQYRQDKDLQALHAAMPMIAVWDDHEIANDTWANGAENHQAGEGSFELRRAAAAAAWLEWLPVRENLESSVLIYRQFSFGNLLDLYMLDTRVVARAEPLDYFSLDTPTMDGIVALVTKARQPDRALLGSHQKDWLQTAMSQSNATWSVMGQQVLMGRIELPSSVMTAMFGLFTATDEQKQAALMNVNSTINAYLSDPNSDPNSVPYNLDAWDGFYYEREWLYGLAQNLNKKFISLAGDSHNAWCSQLKDHSGNAVGVEFATASVSSPGLEEYLGLDSLAISHMEYVLPEMVKELQWADLKQRGFMRLDLTHEKVDSTWHFVSTILQKDYSVETKRVTTNDGKTISMS